MNFSRYNTRLTIVIATCLLFLCAVPTQSVAQSRADKVKISTIAVRVDGSPFIVHTVARREKLGDIATAYGISVERLKEHNPGVSDSPKFRSKLLIPMGGGEPETPQQDQEVVAAVEHSQEQMDSMRNFKHYGDSIFGDDLQYPSINQMSGDTLRQDYGIEFGLTRPVVYGAPVKVALLLPFEAKGTSQKSFVEFFNGFRLALEEIDQDVELTVISTDRTPEKIHQIALSGELDDQNIIVGPIYPEEFEVLAPYAGIKRIPIVSPLGSVGKAQNPFVIEIAPPQQHTWDKVIPMLRDSAANVVVIDHTRYKDSTAMAALTPHLPYGTQRVSYTNKNTHISTLKKTLKRGVPNYIILPFDNEIAVEEVLSRISSARGQIPYDIRVIGTPRWARFEKVDHELFYKLKVHYPTSFYFDRLDRKVKVVYSKYIQKYNGLPTLLTMRGYDVAMLTVGSIYGSGDRLLYDLIEQRSTPMQTPYDFELQSDTTKIYNIEWPLILHKSNYTIEVQ